jgi:hypothetical protein
MCWIKSCGILKLDENNLRVISHPDICNYYKFLFKKYSYNTIKVQTPKHGAHITIVNEKIHGIINLNKIKSFLNTNIDYEYNIKGIFNNQSEKNFKNYFLKVRSKQLNLIMEILKLNNDNDKFLGLHLTILNRKKLC